MFMPSYSKNSLILVQYPYSDLTASKVRPAVIVNAPHPSQDLIIVPLTSQLNNLMPGEFALLHWKAAGLNVPSAVKRGLFTIQQSLVRKLIGQLHAVDAGTLDKSIEFWLGINVPSK
jgi:mRNA interferase MazF